MWINEDKWLACQKTTDEIELLVEGYPCYLGADLSQRKDLTALSATWLTPQGTVSKVWYFTPQEGLEERSKEDKNPYDIWVEQGHIIATPGSIVDYSFVAGTIKGLLEKYDVQGLCFDPWRIELLKAEMKEIGLQIPMVKHGQGFLGGKTDEKGNRAVLWMPRSIEAWEEAILGGTYFVEHNPVTLMCAANARVKSDLASNRVFEKGKASGKMDGTVAQAMSVGFAIEGFPKAEDDTSVYEGSTGFLVIGRGNR
jgi:phage terminase large subunit-like protein